MKKIICCLIVLFVCFTQCVMAKGGHSSHGHSSHGRHSHHSHHHSHHHLIYHNSSHSTPVYLIQQDTKKQEVKFPNCTKHYAVEEITTSVYSDGTKRVMTSSTVFNSDGSTLISNCGSVEHLVFEGKHYFVVYKNKGGWKIINSEGNSQTVKKYSYMYVLKPNRILVRLDKRYGIIDLQEKTVVPVKYRKFLEVSDGVFLTKLNGYWGVVDTENNTLIPNECERIKPVYDTLIIKRYGKYGLADVRGRILYEPGFDKIKKMGEYILLKKNKTYQVLDMEGVPVNDKIYGKIKLNRNKLEGEEVSKSYAK